jgi:hypothetical protein
MFDAGEVIAFAFAFAIAGCGGLGAPKSCATGTSTASTAATFAARLRALEHIKPTCLHLAGASRPRATTPELSGLAFALWLRLLTALLLPLSGGHAVGKLPGLHRL